MQLSYSYIFFSATSSLAYTSPSSTSTTQNARSSSQQLGANSLVHCLLKLAGRDNIKEPLLKALYGLLATLALSSECRNIMFKVSQLLQFVLLSFTKYLILGTVQRYQEMEFPSTTRLAIKCFEMKIHYFGYGT